MTTSERQPVAPTYANVGYAGPSLWTVIGSHFGPRLSEWGCSLNMIILGVVFIARDDIFNTRTFTYFKAVFGSQIVPGSVLFLFGFLGLMGLTINGMRREVTPWIRYSRACIGFLLFTGMSTCFALSGIYTVWLAFFPVAALIELVNMFTTSKDAGETNGYRR